MKGTVIYPRAIPRRVKPETSAGRRGKAARGLSGEPAMVDAIAEDVRSGDLSSLRAVVRALYTLRREKI